MAGRASPARVNGSVTEPSFPLVTNFSVSTSVATEPPENNLKEIVSSPVLEYAKKRYM